MILNTCLRAVEIGKKRVRIARCDFVTSYRRFTALDEARGTISARDALLDRFLRVFRAVYHRIYHSWCRSGCLLEEFRYWRVADLGVFGAVIGVLGVVMGISTYSLNQVLHVKFSYIVCSAVILVRKFCMYKMSSLS